jgi:ADP-ribose pyrophosphatase YjhB (NUDIX family)
MIRAQSIVHRGNKILMVKHRMEECEWWCLPGGGVELSQTPSEVLRELQEECCVSGMLLRQTGHMIDGYSIELVTFLVDIDNQEPRIGVDPEFMSTDQILIDMRWLTLAEILERERAYLLAAGLMSIPVFLEEIST